jgi:N-acetylneuraminic acid mutarotase
MLSTRPVLLLLCAALGASCASGPKSGAPAASAAGTWQSAPPLRHARSAHAVVGDGARLYALGGSGAGGVPVLEVERFDGKTWEPETTLPGDGLNAPAAVLLEGCLYVIGGFEGVSNVPTDRVRCYTPATRTWTELPPLPAPRGGHAAVVLEGKIHVLGGGNSRSTIADHSVYDPRTRTWSERTPLPRAKGSPAALVVDGRIWVLGGRSGPSDFGEVDVYDAVTNAWTPGPPIEPRGTAGAVRFGGALYLFGGESQALGRSLASVLRLDLQEGGWREVAPMPTARSYARAVVLGDAVYVVGGNPLAGRSHSAEGSAVVERFSPP